MNNEGHMGLETHLFTEEHQGLENSKLHERSGHVK